MIDEPKRCDEALLSRYIDGETAPEDTRQIERHLPHCPGCRQFVQQQGQLARQLRREVTAARQAVDFDRLERQITGAAAARRWQPRHWLLSWKLWLPVAATAAVGLFFFTSLFQPPPAGPSAIINSFTGKVSSVMILETPQRHHTVIWYSEESTEGNGIESKKL